jgi:opacity protein-like surface antigen
MPSQWADKLWPLPCLQQFIYAFRKEFQNLPLSSPLRFAALLLLLVVLFAPLAPAQDTPKYEVFGGATYTRQDINEDVNDVHVRYINGIGWHGSLTGNAFSWLGVVFDFSGTFSNPTFGSGDLAKFGVASLPAQINSSTFTYLFGPRFSYRSQRLGRFTPYGEILFGAATLRVSSPQLGITNVISNTSFATALGGGVDARINRRVTLRLFEANYLLTRFPLTDINQATQLPEFGGIRRTQNNIRASVGVVFNIGSIASK